MSSLVQSRISRWPAAGVLGTAIGVVEETKAETESLTQRIDRHVVDIEVVVLRARDDHTDKSVGGGQGVHDLVRDE